MLSRKRGAKTLEIFAEFALFLLNSYVSFYSLVPEELRDAQFLKPAYRRVIETDAAQAESQNWFSQASLGCSLDVSPASL